MNLQNHIHLNLIAIINPSYSVSYRTVKNDVHLGEFANLFGEDGHHGYYYVDDKEVSG